MPYGGYRKLTFRKKPYRKNRYKVRKSRSITGKLGRPSKGLKQSVYLFKRRHTQIIELNTQTPPTGWDVQGNMLGRSMEYHLSDLWHNVDFTQLFGQYKITGVKTTFMFANTGSPMVAKSSSTPHLYSPNCQIIVWMNNHPQGQVPTLDREYFETQQSAKKRLGLNGGKPISCYTPLRQSNMVYRSPTDTDYTLMKPKWISTLEPETPHYGLNIAFERADGQLFANASANYQSVRIETTYYLAFRQVQ